MEKIIAIIFVIGLAGCFSVKPRNIESIKADLVVAGEVQSATDFDVLNGDLIEVWRLYSFGIYDKNNTQIKFVSSGAGCSIKEKENKKYLIFLNKKIFHSGNEKESMYEAFICVSIDNELKIWGGAK